MRSSRDTQPMVARLLSSAAVVPERIEREVLIDAPPETVWAVITQAEHIAGWFSDAGGDRPAARRRGHAAPGTGTGPPAAASRRSSHRIHSRFAGCAPTSSASSARTTRPWSSSACSRRRRHAPARRRERLSPDSRVGRAARPGTPRSNREGWKLELAQLASTSDVAVMHGCRRTSCGRRSRIPPGGGCSTTCSCAAKRRRRRSPASCRSPARRSQAPRGPRPRRARRGPARGREVRYASGPCGLDAARDRSRTWRRRGTQRLAAIKRIAEQLTQDAPKESR